MLKRSLVLTLLFLVTAQVSAMDERPAPVVVAPAAQKAQQGFFAWLISYGTSSAKDCQDASTAKNSPGLSGAPMKMLYMSPEEEAKQHARDVSSKLFVLYPGGAPVASPEPQRSTLKISFGSGGCCP